MPVIDLSGRESISGQIKTKSEYINDLLKYYVENKDGNGEVFKDFNKMYSNIVIIKQYIKEEFDFKVDYIIDVIVSNSTLPLLKDILIKIGLENQVLFLE
jgi:hypothetical protein